MFTILVVPLGKTSLLVNLTWLTQVSVCTTKMRKEHCKDLKTTRRSWPTPTRLLQQGKLPLWVNRRFQPKRRSVTSTRHLREMHTWYRLRHQTRWSVNSGQTAKFKERVLISMLCRLISLRTISLSIHRLAPSTFKTWIQWQTLALLRTRWRTTLRLNIEITQRIATGRMQAESVNIKTELMKRTLMETSLILVYLVQMNSNNKSKTFKLCKVNLRIKPSLVEEWMQTKTCLKITAATATCPKPIQPLQLYRIWRWLTTDQEMQATTHLKLRRRKLSKQHLT